MSLETDRDLFTQRLGVQQRLLPSYRAPFFDALAEACPAGLSVFAGQPMPGESMGPAGELHRANFCPTRNRYLLGGSLVLVWQPGLLAWLDDWQPQALILEANPRNRSNPAGVRWMHARRRPVIGWGLGAPEVSGRLAALRRSWWQGYLRQFDALITYSRQGAEQFGAIGFPAGRIFVAPNAVTPRPAGPLPSDDRPASASGRPSVLFVGRLQARKRVDLLLKACSALPAPLQPDLWVVGEGPARAEFEAAARAVYPRAEFLGDRRGADLDDLFARADLFVLPGTGGLAVQQAMAKGLPVIVAEADGTQADLVRPENGWCVPPGDLPALTAVLGEALSDLAKLRRMGEASYRIVAAEVNLESMVAAFVQAVNGVSR